MHHLLSPRTKMVGSETPETATSSAAPIAETIPVIGYGGEEDEESYPSSFQCCVCLDLLYKPIVLACGHISCFWCVHKAMHDLRASHCALCRQPYIHFPSICQQLHYLLLKMEPVAYNRREHEVLEEEKRRDIFSPQFGDFTVSEDKSGAPEEIKKSLPVETGTSQAVKKHSLTENGTGNGKGKQVFVDDLLCALCKELLFLPAVLNCGHVFCDSCISGLATEPLNCAVCESLHPGEFPNVCLDLDHFLQEQFPKEYAIRKEGAPCRRVECQRGESSNALQGNKNGKPPYSKEEHLLLEDDLRNVHVGVGCDSCGMYPLVGKRYKCKDCKETIGFDLCEACYNSSSKLPGRFNQQHTPDHRFEIDDSQMLCKILFRSLVTDNHHQDPPIEGDLLDDHDDIDNNNDHDDIEGENCME